MSWQTAVSRGLLLRTRAKGICCQVIASGMAWTWSRGLCAHEEVAGREVKGTASGGHRPALDPVSVWLGSSHKSLAFGVTIGQRWVAPPTLQGLGATACVDVHYLVRSKQRHVETSETAGGRCQHLAPPALT